ncbi:hypothetical protein Bca4012_047676 [Brassica carinata]
MGDKTPSPFSLHYSLFRCKPLHHSLMSASVSAECHSSSTVDPPSLIVFSSGTGFNGVVEELKKITTRVAHVLPVSDDGGRSSVYVSDVGTGGPAVGDIRSRCLRLSDESTSEALAVRRLLGHRLPITLSSTHMDYLLNSFPSSFLVRHIGNFFFAGARIFFQSLDAAIFLFSRVSQIPCDSLVLPVISTNDRLTLGCELQDGTIIRRQNEISHPTSGTAYR